MLYFHRKLFYFLIGISIVYLVLWEYSMSSKNTYCSSLVLSSRSQNSVKELIQYDIDFRLLTAFSDNHFAEALCSCKLIGNLNETQNWKSGYMIAYILSNDISERQLNQYRNECPFVTLRQFNNTKYPGLSQNLFEYRWKPIIVDEMLKEVEKVFYFDSSVVFHQNSNESIKDLIQKVDENICGIRFFAETKHSILFATHPKMLQYFNVSEDIAKKTEMVGATLFIITRRTSDIIKKWKKCALEKECMAPKGSQRSCKCVECGRKNIYANCHRFDQSAIALLTLQCNSNLTDFSKSSPLLSIERS